MSDRNDTRPATRCIECNVALLGYIVVPDGVTPTQYCTDCAPDEPDVGEYAKDPAVRSRRWYPGEGTRERLNQ